MSAINGGLVAIGVLAAVTVFVRLLRISLSLKRTGPSGATQIDTLGGSRRFAFFPPKNRLVVLFVMVSAAYSWLASGTQPFTVGSGLVCAIAFAPMAWLAWSRILAMRKAARSTMNAGMDAHLREMLEPWLLAIAFLIFWELVTYFAGFGGHRNEFPTLSVIDNYVSSLRPSKAVVFFLWLVLGWAMFRP